MTMNSNVFIVGFLIVYLIIVLAVFLKYRMKGVEGLFIFSFLLILVMPLLFMDTTSVISSFENRVLAPRPSLADGLNLFKQTDAYINDRFGFREYFLKVNHLINREVLHRQDRKVLFGKNGWLFYINKGDGDNFSDFQKTNLPDPETLSAWVEALEQRAAWCEENGIRFLFLIAPNKHNIYPEYYPVGRPDGPTRTDIFLEHLPPSLRDQAIFPRDYLLEQKEQEGTLLYYETDTHWNNLGAYYAFEVLYGKIKSWFPDRVFPDIDYRRTIFERGPGDLVPMLGIETYGRTTEVEMEPATEPKRSGGEGPPPPSLGPVGGWSSYYSYRKYEGIVGREGIITENVDRNLPRAVIFRDSFFMALEPFTSCMFSEAEYIWHPFSSKEKAHILENKPDILIWETVERSLPDSLSSAWD